MDAHHDQASGPRAPAAAPPIDRVAADTLSDVLEAVRLTGALFFLVDASTPWVAEAPRGAVLGPIILPRVQHVVSYHLVTAGACWCQMPGHTPERIETGDILVVPHGDEYALSSEIGLQSGLTLDESLGWFRQMAAGALPFVVDEGGGGPGRVGVVCGFLGCDALPFNPVLASLPALLHVRRPVDSSTDGLAMLIDLAVRESRERQAGARSVLLRIAELLFVEVVRRFLTTVQARDGGWLAGLRDPVVGAALAQLHRDPARPWTLDALAHETAVSRSVLTERFTQAVGHPPMHYLMRWRMQLAAARLLESSAKVSAVAHDVGYDSEAAFSRAFKKVTGTAPVAWRSHQRHEATPEA